MDEPNTGAFVATGVIIAALGPVLGPALLITFGAVAGSLLAMSKADTMTRLEALNVRRLVLNGTTLMKCAGLSLLPLLLLKPSA